jgi:hypothetical protein
MRPPLHSAPVPPFAGLRAKHPAAVACQLDAHFGDEWLSGEWALLGLECEDAVEDANGGYDPPEPSKRHQPMRRSTASSAIKPGAVALSDDDPLKSIEPRVYVEALTGEVVPANGMMRCPLPDHDDHTPSFQVLSSHWRCFGCNRGGSVIDFAAALYGIEPRGSGYVEIRRRLLADLGVGRPV